MEKKKRIIGGVGVTPPNAAFAGVEGGRIQGDAEKTLRTLILQAASSRAQSAMDLQYAADQMEREDLQRGGKLASEAANKRIEEHLGTITDAAMLGRVEADLRGKREKNREAFRRMVAKVVESGGRPPLPPPPSAEELTQPYEQMIKATINAIRKKA